MSSLTHKDIEKYSFDKSREQKKDDEDPYTF